MDETMKRKLHPFDPTPHTHEQTGESLTVVLDAFDQQAVYAGLSLLLGQIEAGQFLAKAYTGRFPPAGPTEQIHSMVCMLRYRCAVTGDQAPPGERKQ